MPEDEIEGRVAEPQSDKPSDGRGTGKRSRQSREDGGRSTESIDEAIELLDRINDAVARYDPSLREKASTVLMERAFGNVPREAGVAGGTPQAAPSSSDFSALLEKWRPDTNPKWALLGAYFHTKVKGHETVSGQEINTTLKHYGTTIRNITDALSANIAARPAFILQVSKSGSSRQSRKTYRVTTQGLQYVEARLRGEPEKGR